ncbi:MAG TPA: phosphate ABC transporter permease PstA [Chloroflexota bacterium]|nr:phosphate ABC transporter permease PstA [Chloroflexota bacterium]
MAVVATSPSTAQTLLTARGRLRRRAIVDRVATALMALSALAGVIVLLLILIYSAINGLPALDLAFFTERPLPPGEVGGGVAPAILGTIEMLVVAALIGVPIGMGTAIYLAEYGRGSFARTVSFLIDLIAGLPSIVIGVFVWTWLVRHVVGHYNGLAGSVALAVIMIPIVTRTVEETLRLVPDPLREASLALGIPRWKTILRVVLPTARAGIITGVVLSIARAGGETAPLLLTALGNQFFSYDLLQPMAALPVQIYTYARSPYADWQVKAWGAALILIVLIGALSLLSRWVVARRLGHS